MTSSDTDTAHFTILITVANPVDCVPNLTPPTNIATPAPYSYEYQIGQPRVDLELYNLSNGNCGFTIDFVQIDDSPVDSAVFTITDTTFTIG